MDVCTHVDMMAIWLWFQNLAKYAKESDYNVLLLFQPGEEKPGGAKPIIESGFFKKFNIAAIYGTHIYPELEKGKVYTRPNEMMAGGCEFELLVKGKASHAAQPQNGINALVACVEILQKSLEQEEKTFDDNTFHLLHFGTFHSGSAFNMIAEGFLGGLNKKYQYLTVLLRLPLSTGILECSLAHIGNPFIPEYQFSTMHLQ